VNKYISYDDIIHIFEPQLKRIKRDELANNQVSQDLLKKYISAIVLLMVKHYITIGITRIQYEKETVTTNERAGWRRSILTELHDLDRETVDVQVICEGGTTFANQINIKAYMNW